MEWLEYEFQYSKGSSILHGLLAHQSVAIGEAVMVKVFMIFSSMNNVKL